jgi:hypothetical protein
MNSNAELAMRNQLSPAGAAGLDRILRAAKVALVREPGGLATLRPAFFSLYDQTPQPTRTPAGPVALNQPHHAATRAQGR